MTAKRTLTDRQWSILQRVQRNSTFPQNRGDLLVLTALESLGLVGTDRKLRRAWLTEAGQRFASGDQPT